MAVGLLFTLVQIPSLTFSGEISAELFRDDFKNWRDNSTDPGFNTQVKSSGGKLVITSDSEYGKSMSKIEPITLNVTKLTEMVVEVDRIDSGATATISLMSAYEPFDTFQIARVQDKGGVYTANVNSITGWAGVNSVWIVVWLEGKDKSVAFKGIFFQDKNVETARRKEATLNSYMAKKFAPAPEDSIFYEDFRNGINGWRTAETDPGFFSELDFEGGAPRLRFIQNKGHCKLMSPLAGIRTDITSNTRFEVALGDMGSSRVKCDLMTAQPPYDSHQIIAWTKVPGVYRANVSEATKWFGGKTFCIVVWLEATQSVSNEKGAVLKYFRVYEGGKE